MLEGYYIPIMLRRTKIEILIIQGAKTKEFIRHMNWVLMCSEA